MSDANLALENPETLDSPFLYDRGGFLSSLRHEMRQLYRFRALVRYLVGQGLARERRMVLGALWWLIDPVLMMLIYVVLIGVVLKRGGPGYPALVLVGVISWKYFTATVNKSMGGLNNKASLMKQVAFPRSVVPLAALLTESVHFLIGICLAILIAGTIYGGTAADPTSNTPAYHVFTYHILGVIPVLVVQGLIGLGLGFLFATANVFLRDTQLMLSHFFRIWFYLSPGLYTAEQATSRLHGIWLTLFNINPFTPLFSASRQAILFGEWPDWASLGWVALGGVVVLAIGYSVFVHFEPEFNKVS